MKKAYVLLGTLALHLLPAQAQITTNQYEKKKVNKTDIELLYQHYLQDGEHSAVTGGEGTEELTVYAPSISINKNFNNKSILGVEIGADVITSASTDNIDFSVSSASIRDTRSHINLNYSKNILEKRLVVGVGSGLSIESDYFSIPFNFSLAYTSKNTMRSYTFAFQSFFDDLRWGRLDQDHLLQPIKLIYPEELRGTDWHDTYKRQSYNLKLGLTQIINKRNTAGIFSTISYQTGLLATPFHRIYFIDGSQAVENLPSQRIKGSLAIQQNSFLGNFTVLKNGIDFYMDSFGILSIAIDNETAFKVSPTFTLAPFGRLYLQKGTTYFAPYGEHELAETYFTSDYDLSTLQSFKLGLGFRYHPNANLAKQLFFKQCLLRYAYYQRSDGLKAHVLSLAFDLKRVRNYEL